MPGTSKDEQLRRAKGSGNPKNSTFEQCTLRTSGGVAEIYILFIYLLFFPNPKAARNDPGMVLGVGVGGN